MSSASSKRPPPAGLKPPCPYGLKCYRTKNPVHTGEMYHPQIDGPINQPIPVIPQADELKDKFPSPFHVGEYGAGRKPMSLVEIAMHQLSEAIRKKPNWRAKRLDKSITDKWRKEALVANELLSEEAVDYVFAELAHYDQDIDPSFGIEMSTVDGVYQSDRLLPQPLVDALCTQINALFGTQTDEEKDWHPGSNKQVWDIVHPSLYCAVAGRTRVVDQCAQDSPIASSPIAASRAWMGLEINPAIVDQLKHVGSGEVITPAQFLLRSLHPHLLTKKAASPKFKGRWICDLCKSPGAGDSYRCEICNFDACSKCCRRAENLPNTPELSSADVLKVQDDEADDEKDSQDETAKTPANNQVEQEEKQDVLANNSMRDGDDGSDDGILAAMTVDMDVNTQGEAEEIDDDEFDSAKYAWLPSDVSINQNSEVLFQSYINNLHPVKHQSLYPIINQILFYFVPMFEKVLTDLRKPFEPKVEVGQFYAEGEGIDDWSEAFNLAQEENPDLDEDEFVEEWERTRKVIQPKPKPFTYPQPLANFVTLRGRTIQVITKIAQIHLTPDNPDYAGGVWHVEGMRNESIVASGIAYFSQDNIGPSELAFRTDVCEPDYEQNDHEGPKQVFGLENDGALTQRLGSVDTKNGGCIAFPNAFQHRVSPFSLVDKSRPGHRSILVFFLVDPTVNILSTSTVPPQQLDWVKAEFEKPILDAFNGAKVIQEMVSSYIDWPMTLPEAVKHRERLMKERKFFVDKHSRAVFERFFSLCEH